MISRKVSASPSVGSNGWMASPAKKAMGKNRTERANHFICKRSTPWALEVRSTRDTTAAAAATIRRFSPTNPTRSSTDRADSTPRGLSMVGKLSIGPGRKASLRTMSTKPTKAMRVTHTHRGASRRPVGNSRNTHTKMPKPGTASQSVSQAASSPGLPALRERSPHACASKESEINVAARRKSQPMGFSGRRLATSAPTKERATAQSPTTT